MAKIITFERISWIVNVNNRFLELDFRADANVTGVSCRKLKDDHILIFCNHNPSNAVHHIFAHKLSNEKEVINNPIYFANNLLNSVTLCQSMDQFYNYSIVCTSMQKDVTTNDIVYWDNADEIVNDNIVKISKIHTINGVRTNIINGLYNNLVVPNLSINDIEITGITINKKTNKMLFSIGNIDAGNDYAQQGIIVESLLSSKGNLSINDEFNIIGKYDINQMFTDNGVVCGESYVTDICFDDNSNKLILLTACSDTSSGYIWTIQWYDHINVYSSIPKLVRSNYDNEILKFNQSPKGIKRIDDALNTYSITFKYDEELVFNQDFDYCVIELNL